MVRASTGAAEGMPPLMYQVSISVFAASISSRICGGSKASLGSMAVGIWDMIGDVAVWLLCLPRGGSLAGHAVDYI